MEIKTLVAKAHENAVKHGFWEPTLPFGTAIALIHSELSKPWKKNATGTPTSGSRVLNVAVSALVRHKTKLTALCMVRKACASTEAKSPKVWPSNWLTR